jgi:hypothetical protein
MAASKPPPAVAGSTNSLTPDDLVSMPNNCEMSGRTKAGFQPP